jgi:hypothetical protein
MQLCVATTGCQRTSLKPIGQWRLYSQRHKNPPCFHSPDACRAAAYPQLIFCEAQGIDPSGAHKTGS